MDRLLVVDPKELTIWFELGRKSTGVFRIRNVMHTMPVAFKVESTAPRAYSVKPSTGIIPPLGSLTLDVVMYALKTLPESGYPISEDKFMVNSVVVPGGLPPNRSVSPDWFSPGKKQVFADGHVRVVFVGGVILRTLVSQDTKHALELVREVLDRDVDGEALNGKDGQGRTAMHLAVASGRAELVQVLLEFGANLEIKNALGNTALHDAASMGECLMVELLLAKGAEPSSCNSRGWTPLHLALVRGQAEVARLLLAKGARSTAALQDGRTAVDLARSDPALLQVAQASSD